MPSLYSKRAVPFVAMTVLACASEAPSGLPQPAMDGPAPHAAESGATASTESPMGAVGGLPVPGQPAVPAAMTPDGSNPGAAVTAGQTVPGTPSENTPGAAPVNEASDAEPVTPAPGRRIARLTHFQWRNAVHDLLRLPSPPDQVQDFTPDAIVGFDTNADQLRMSSTLREDYERAAEELAAQVVSDPQALANLLPEDAPTEPSARARAFIEGFGLRAYRRPLTPQEVEEYVELFEQGAQLTPELAPFEAGVMLCLRLFLQSPYFLYRTELEVPTASADRIGLSGYEVAAKLALTLTGSIPDDELLDAAANGRLDPYNDVAIDEQVRRLLETPRGKASALHLHSQVLALSRYDLIRRDAEEYPEFSEQTPASMRRSAELFLNAAYDEGRGVKTLLTSPEAFINGALAPLYGVSDVTGDDFVRLDLSEAPRRGLLTQAGFLALFAGQHHPDPIHRGVFISHQVLCLQLPPPAPDIPPLPEPQPNQTNRQRIDLLTGPGTCGEGCHTHLINPLGFAFEHYDPIGRYRTMDGGVTVDASDTYNLDGTPQSYDNALELVELLADSAAAHRCYAEHWLSYLFGRPMAPGDESLLDALATRSQADDLSTKDVVLGIALDNAFLSRPEVE